jgi:hypothetical protein
LHFESNSDGHIRIAQLVEGGVVEQLFPNPEKGLTDDRLRPFVPRALPADDHWLRFDDRRGRERLLILFSPSRESLERYPLSAPGVSQEVLEIASRRRGDKGLIVEADETVPAEQGFYAVSLDGGPIIQELVLIHE